MAEVDLTVGIRATGLWRFRLALWGIKAKLFLFGCQACIWRAITAVIDKARVLWRRESGR